MNYDKKKYPILHALNSDPHIYDLTDPIMWKKYVKEADAYNLEQANAKRSTKGTPAPIDVKTYYYTAEAWSNVDMVQLIVSDSEKYLTEEFDEELEIVMGENGWEELMEHCYMANVAWNTIDNPTDADIADREPLRAIILSEAKKLPSNFVESAKLNALVKSCW